ncbi:hypothetical protein WJX82_007522 [Trebouxia sp. C0006]
MPPLIVSVLCDLYQVHTAYSGYRARGGHDSQDASSSQQQAGTDYRLGTGGLNKSRYRGVSYDKKKRKWRVQIKVATLGKSGVSVGYYDTEENAARAYDRAAIGLLGRDNCSITTNFPLGDYDEEIVPQLIGKTREEVKTTLKNERAKVPRRRFSSRQRTSRYMGVGSSNRKNQWQARILVHGKVTHLGYYETEEEAARVYDRVSISLHGEAAQTNFPPGEYQGQDTREYSGLDREDLQRALGVKPMDKSSKFRGVSKKKGKWEAKVMVNRKWAYRELFDSEEEAARAYDGAVWRLKPKEAKSYVNFKERPGQASTKLAKAARLIERAQNKERVGSSQNSPSSTRSLPPLAPAHEAQFPPSGPMSPQKLRTSMSYQDLSCNSFKLGSPQTLHSPLQPQNQPQQQQQQQQQGNNMMVRVGSETHFIPETQASYFGMSRVPSAPYMQLDQQNSGAPPQFVLDSRMHSDPNLGPPSSPHFGQWAPDSCQVLGIKQQEVSDMQVDMPMSNQAYTHSPNDVNNSSQASMNYMLSQPCFQPPNSPQTYHQPQWQQGHHMGRSASTSNLLLPGQGWMSQDQSHVEGRGDYGDQMAAAHLQQQNSAMHFAHHSSNSIGQAPYDGPPSHPGENRGVNGMGPCDGGHHQDLLADLSASQLLAQADMAECGENE